MSYLQASSNSCSISSSSASLYNEPLSTSSSTTIVTRSLRNPNNRWREFLCVEKTHPEAIIPTRDSELNAGYDLYAVEQTVIPAWGRGVVNTHIKVLFPQGTCGEFKSRSGLSFNNNIEVGAGLIDENYQGELKVLLRNFSDVDFIVQPKSKITQMVLRPYVSTAIHNVKSIVEINGGTSDRGANGFGSSDRKKI